ncbi:hypothetical protein BVY01_02805 [bacterium I07]|nr:hypothetical protein BVY01_02805 [bacterium I07]
MVDRNFLRQPDYTDSGLSAVSDSGAPGSRRSVFLGFLLAAAVNHGGCIPDHAGPGSCNSCTFINNPWHTAGGFDLFPPLGVSGPVF